MGPGKLKKTSMWLIALVTWFALGLQLYVLVSNTPGNGMTVGVAIGRFFIFFTILSNLLVAISLSCMLITPASPSGRFFQRASVSTAIALYILVVGLVYNIVLRSLWHPVGLQKLADELLHVYVPLGYILFWAFYGPKSSLQWMAPFQWLIFPSLYLVYALTRGALEGFYPYPFIDAKELSFGRLFINSITLMFVFLILGYLFVAVSKKLKR
jgi:hypothetical protein